MLAVPTQDYRRTEYRVPPHSLTGLDAAVNGFIGDYRRRGSVVAGLKAEADAILLQEREWAGMADNQLHQRLMEFREHFRRGGAAVNAVVGPALAAIREAADRQLGMRPFGVQLMGALALHRGYLAEMATGEGKTLTASLAAILAGWSRLPCHVVTVNDYLVQRDAEWLAPLYHWCGVRVGFVTGTAQAPERIKGYGCDVTYVTSKELLADFLRDRLKLGRLQDPTRRLIRRMLAPQTEAQDGLMLRGLHSAIVDEADSVLIDEAVTPLIISASHKNDSLRNVVEQAQAMIQMLETPTDYQTNPRYKEIELTKSGLEKLVGQAAQLPGIWGGQERRLELVIQALAAREFFHRDRQYIVNEGKIVIVDEFTGRPMPQRTWQEGLHQAVEAKEGLPVSDPSETVARLSFQRFFRYFHKLSGMSGTVQEAAGEVWQVYGLPIVKIPHNKPCIRQQIPDCIFLTEDEKFEAIADEVQRRHATGQPILVGTRSVQTSEKLGQKLAERGMESKILNASRLSEEAPIVALAGEPGRITIATNMAGRGTDIKLGRGVTGLGGLHVIASERHESGRVDRQLFGRSARQGDPGSAQAFFSLEDELLQKYLPKTVREGVNWAWKNALPGQKRLALAAINRAQRKAQNIAFKQRKGVLRSDVSLDEALSFAGGDTI